MVVGTVSIGLTTFLFEEGFDVTVMSEAEIKNTLIREFKFMWVNHQLTIMSKNSGRTYTDTSINWDVFNATFEGMQNTTANKVISYLEGDETVNIGFSYAYIF